MRSLCTKISQKFRTLYCGHFANTNEKDVGEVNVNSKLFTHLLTYALFSDVLLNGSKYVLFATKVD